MIESVDINNCSINFPKIGYPNILDGICSNTFTITEDTIIQLGDYNITARELANKLQLLDKLIKEHLPEEVL